MRPKEKIVKAFLIVFYEFFWAIGMGLFIAGLVLHGSKEPSASNIFIWLGIVFVMIAVFLIMIKMDKYENK